MMELCFLGPARVSLAGNDPPAELLWRKNLALLLYLARSPRGRTRDHLVGLLWPDKDDAKARHSLNEALRVLRRSLGDALETSADTVTLAAGSVRADLDALEGASVEVLGRPFLEGFTVPEAPEFENWIVAERARLRAMQLALLVERSGRALASGRTAVAREAAEAALALDPHHEAAVRLLMSVHALEGARGQALAVFDRFTDRLDEDLGVAADPETARLAERIRQGRIVRGAPPSAAQPRVPLIGPAQGLLEQMVEVWGDVLRGEPRVIVIYGDAGTGKTRLLDELSARARLDGAAVVYGLAEATARPALVVVDLAEGAVPELAASVSRQRGVCLAIAASSRSHTFDVIAERVGRDQGAVLRTESFGAEAVADLVRWAFPTYEPGYVDRLVRRIVVDTAGNPFLVSELVLALRDGLRLPGASRAWPDPLRTLDQTMPADLPESVAAALRVRYRSLSEPAQRAVAAVAVLGADAAVDAVARGAELERTALDAALDEAEWARWLVPNAHGYALTTRLAGEVIARDMVTGGQARRIRERAKG